jgi:hypothetical protein
MPESRALDASSMSSSSTTVAMASGGCGGGSGDFEREIAGTADSLLPYSIDSFSSYMGNYLPHNIIDDKPFDPTSRWSSTSTSNNQYLVLALKDPAIVRILIDCSTRSLSLSLYP